MRKKQKVIILMTLIIICAVAGIFTFWRALYFFLPLTKSAYGYNPNYADALQHNKPELCKNINYALQSGPTDSINKVYGDQAVALCESQAKAGLFGCECDSDAVLDAMRKR